jgi:hypothetical protein
MADVTIAVEKVTRTGINLTDTGSLSTGNTYVIRNSGKMVLHFKKTGSGVCSASIQTPSFVGGLAVAELTVNVPATSGDILIGPFPPGIFNDGSKDVRVTFDDVVGLTIAAFEVAG